MRLSIHFRHTCNSSDLEQPSMEDMLQTDSGDYRRDIHTSNSSEHLNLSNTPCALEVIHSPDVFASSNDLLHSACGTVGLDEFTTEGSQSMNSSSNTFDSGTCCHGLDTTRNSSQIPRHSHVMTHPGEGHGIALWKITPLPLPAAILLLITPVQRQMRNFVMSFAGSPVGVRRLTESLAAHYSHPSASTISVRRQFHLTTNNLITF